MPQSCCHSLRGIYSVPPLSAIEHGSNPVNFEDEFFLPSSCHDRTWLLDTFQETFRETTSCKETNREQELCTEDSNMQSACLPRVIQTACSNARSCERTACLTGNSSSVLECVSQSCQSENNQKMGFVVQRCQPVSYMTKCCSPNTYMSKNYQTLKSGSSKCQSQGSESCPCKPVIYVTQESQVLESSSSYEPTCCVTGGLQLPSQ